MAGWTDPDASQWTWHLCTVREPARARRELSGLVASRPSQFAAIFEPTEVITVPEKRHGQIIRQPGRGNKAKLRHIQKPLYSGYWFVSPVNGADWQEIDHTEGVIGIIRKAGDSSKPWEARGDLMQMFFDRERSVMRHASAKVRAPGENFRPNQQVIIAAGPMADFKAIVSGIDKSGRVSLLIDIFGRQSATYADASDLVAA